MPRQSSHHDRDHRVDLDATAIRRAITDDELVLRFQPLVARDPGRVMGAGAHTCRGADHRVAFHDDEGVVRSAVDFLAPALRVEGLAVVIATPQHRRRIVDRLEALGLATSPTPDGLPRLLTLDAARTLTAIAPGGTLSLQALHAVLGTPIATATDAGRAVRVHGEMVGLLSRDGEFSAAVELEERYNDLLATLPFQLLCTYPVDAFAEDPTGAAFQAVCDRHATVLPTEAVNGRADGTELLRRIAELQQELVVAVRARDRSRDRHARLEADHAQLREEAARSRATLARIAHDLRNAAAVLGLGMATLRSRSTPLDEERLRSTLDTMASQVDELAELTQRLGGAGAHAGPPA